MKTNVIVKEMTPAAIKRSVWRRDGNTIRAYRRVKYAGSVRLVPAVDVNGKQWTRIAPDEDYLLAARRVLTAEAAERYCNGDLSVVDEISENLIAEEASKIASEREQQ